MALTAGDDSTIQREPTRHVDYLSHNWCEEDIRSSWRYITNKKDTYEHGSRLENAAWRSWTKLKFGLGTVSPESLNWLKDVDVTWLYGPLQTDASSHEPPASPPNSVSDSTSSSSFLDKKSILKKRTVSQSIIQRSLSTHTLLNLADEILRAPNIGRSVSHYGVPRDHIENTIPACTTDPLAPNAFSYTHSLGEKRHISFSNEVAQCVAVDGEGKEYDDDDVEGLEREGSPYSFYDYDYGVLDDDESSDDGLLMMGPFPPKSSLSAQTTPRSSFSSDSRTIAPLPSTTLKYRCDTPEPEMEAVKDDLSRRVRPPLSRSSSTDTLRPAKTPSHLDLFLDEDNSGGDWDPGWDSEYNCHGNDSPNDTSTFREGPSINKNAEQNEDRGMYISSGVFMPFGYGDNDRPEDDEWNDDGRESLDRGIVDKVVDTVNTAKDIAHVIWNVGWGG